MGVTRTRVTPFTYSTAIKQQIPNIITKGFDPK